MLPQNRGLLAGLGRVHLRSRKGRRVLRRGSICPTRHGRLLSRYNRASEVRRVVYEHLTVPIRRISGFRQGAEVALKVPMQIRRQEFWFALLQTLIS